MLFSEEESEERAYQRLGARVRPVALGKLGTVSLMLRQRLFRRFSFLSEYFFFVTKVTRNNN